MKIKTFQTLAGIALLSVSIPALAAATGKIHGHVTDPTGIPKTNGNVYLTTDGGFTLSKLTCPVSATGDYVCEGIADGTYSVVYKQPDTPAGKLTDIIDNVKIEDGADVLVDIDMTRKAYIDKMTPEQKKQVEEYRAKNALALKNNAVVKQLNADLAVARTENHDKKYADAETLMLKDTAIKADGELLWYELGVAQLGLRKLDDATASLKKTLDLATAPNKKPTAELIGGAQAALGETYARNGKADDAQAEYDLAAKSDPTKAAFFYRNEAIVFQNMNNNEAEAAAADKAIAADPKDPLPYYLKGQALISKATFDSKTNLMTLPPDCTEAYKKYLELAPNGQFANDVKGILAQASTKVETKVSNKKK